jgi:D-alanyl-D-alanine carboxypeptidase (penicillin-binding protein 5/6)
MFTARIVINYLPLDMKLQVGEELDRVASNASRMGLRKGDILTVEDLLYGMLLRSGNDAAYTLAVGAGRVIADDEGLSADKALSVFMQTMNTAAQEAGLTGTHFVTPDGYHHSNHYSTPRDILTMAQLLMDDPILFNICGTQSYQVATAAGRKIQLPNTNMLLNPNSDYYCPEAVGLKTGFTTPAGYCMVAVFRTERGFVIAGVLKADSLAHRANDAFRLWNTFKDYT